MPTEDNLRANSGAYASELAPSESNIGNSLDRMEEGESLSLDQIIASFFSVVDNDVAQVGERVERVDDSVRAYLVYLSLILSYSYDMLEADPCSGQWRRSAGRASNIASQPMRRVPGTFNLVVTHRALYRWCIPN